MISKNEVIKEIDLIPKENLSEIYNFIRYFRIGLEKGKEKTTVDSLLSYAGSWQDMEEEVFDEYLSDIAKRRKQAFIKRRADEASTD